VTRDASNRHFPKVQLESLAKEKFGKTPSRGVTRHASMRRNLSPEQKAEARKAMRAVAFELRAEDPKKWTQAAVAKTLGIGQHTVSDWFSVTNTQQRNRSNSGSAKASKTRPDARIKVTPGMRNEVAADYSIQEVAA